MLKNFWHFQYGALIFCLTSGFGKAFSVMFGDFSMAREKKKLQPHFHEICLSSIDAGQPISEEKALNFGFVAKIRCFLLKAIPDQI